MTGTIRKLKKTEGFGFIRGEDGTDRFFHKTAVAAGTNFDVLNEGQRVTFEHREGNRDKETGQQKGPRAVQVELG